MAVNHTFQAQTIEYALGRVVDIDTQDPRVGRNGWVQWRVLEFYPEDYPRPDRANHVRVCLIDNGGVETLLHWPTLCVMLSQGRAIME